MDLLYSIKSKLRSQIYSCCNFNKLNLHQTTSQLLKYSKKCTFLTLQFSKVNV